MKMDRLRLLLRTRITHLTPKELIELMIEIDPEVEKELPERLAKAMREKDED